MKEIQLSKGKVAIIDDQDYEKVSARKWHFSSSTGYAEGHRGVKTINMHAEIMNTPFGMVTDHINGDKLDNRRVNLRVCTNMENRQNSKIGKNNSSLYRGVVSSGKKWKAQITKNKTYYYLGTYNTKYEAAIAYDTACIRLYGENFALNFRKDNS